MDGLPEIAAGVPSREPEDPASQAGGRTEISSLQPRKRLPFFYFFSYKYAEPSHFKS